MTFFSRCRGGTRSRMVTTSATTLRLPRRLLFCSMALTAASSSSRESVTISTGVKERPSVLPLRFMTSSLGLGGRSLRLSYSNCTWVVP